MSPQHPLMDPSPEQFELPATGPLASERVRPATGTRARPMRTFVVAGPGKPAEAELRRRIAADLMPDVVSAEDAIGAVVVDDRYFEARRGILAGILRRLPLIVAQGIEVSLHGNRFDAVLTWSDRPAIMIGALLRFRRRRPKHVAILMWPSKAKKALLLAQALGGIDRFIMWPPLQRRFVEEKLGVPASRIDTAFHPVDTEFWRPMPGNGGLICSVGQEMRDYGTLVEALAPLEIPCHIAAGTGLFNARFLDKEWKRNVGEQTLPANVTFGRKGHLELRELYANSRFVVVPLIPTDMDNGITVIIEAFSMGKAVVCTETPGQTGLLEHGVNCVRVPAFDAEALRTAIVDLWNDPEKCARMGAAGRQAVEERHCIDRWTATLVDAINKASGAGARG
jgi:glycosyltransferase involved in cell wall biosynthesis